MAIYIREDEDGTIHYTLTQPGVAPEPAGKRSAELPRALLYDGTEAWDWDAAAIVDVLPALRDQRWAAVKAARDAAQDGGCSTPAGRADSDPDSRGKISGAVQLAMIAQAAGQAFAIDWTMSDNSTAHLDGAGMIALGIAVGQHVAACHEAGLAKRAAIDAAASRADIEAVGAADGWPS